MTSCNNRHATVRSTSTSIVSKYVPERAAKIPFVGFSGVPWGAALPFHMVVITAFLRNHLFTIENHVKQPKIDEFCKLCQFVSSWVDFRGFGLSISVSTHHKQTFAKIFFSIYCNRKSKLGVKDVSQKLCLISIWLILLKYLFFGGSDSTRPKSSIYVNIQQQNYFQVISGCKNLKKRIFAKDSLW